MNIFSHLFHSNGNKKARMGLKMREREVIHDCFWYTQQLTTFTFNIFSQTDDYGVFSTSLTRELKICVQVFGLTKSELIDLTVNANKYSFARPEERQLISDKIEAFKAETVLD
jgi:hypothetical protein